MMYHKMFLSPFFDQFHKKVGLQELTSGWGGLEGGAILVSSVET